jgi:hypothetical protein
MMLVSNKIKVILISSLDIQFSNLYTKNGSLNAKNNIANSTSKVYICEEYNNKLT